MSGPGLVKNGIVCLETHEIAAGRQLGPIPAIGNLLDKIHDMEERMRSEDVGHSTDLYSIVSGGFE